MPSRALERKASEVIPPENEEESSDCLRGFGMHGCFVLNRITLDRWSRIEKSEACPEN